MNVPPLITEFLAFGNMAAILRVLTGVVNQLEGQWDSRIPSESTGDSVMGKNEGPYTLSMAVLYKDTATHEDGWSQGTRYDNKASGKQRATVQISNS